jgi:CubicO group peptidase (beta-lactamase class C family)
MTSLLPLRRRSLRLAGALALSAAGCAHSDRPGGAAAAAGSPAPGAPTGAALRPGDPGPDGIGRHPGGPELGRYTDASGGYPLADRQTWWRVDRSVDAYSRLDEILRAGRSPRPAQAIAWQRAPAEPRGHYLGAPGVGPGRLPFQAYLDRNPATGLIIAQGDTLLMERYQYGRHERHRFTSFSMAKTVIAMMVGIALDEGLIRSLDDPAQAYQPALAGTAYGQTPLRHLLTMSSGVRFREDYDGTDDSSRLSRATVGEGSAGGAAAVRIFNERIAPPGARWYYASAETFVLAVVLQAAIGQPLPQWFAERVWQPMGAEADASWLVDRSGQAVGYMGFNAVLRDYARFGRLLAGHGRIEGRQIIPRAWVIEASRAHFSGQQTGRWYGYGYQTWVFPENDGSFALLGVRGQAMFIDPARQLVLAHTAVRPAARDPGGADLVALWRGLRAQIAPVRS